MPSMLPLKMISGMLNEKSQYSLSSMRSWSVESRAREMSFRKILKILARKEKFFNCSNLSVRQESSPKTLKKRLKREKKRQG